MEPVKPETIDQLIADISSIKSVISKNQPVLNRILLPAPLRLVSIIGGVSIIVFCAVFFILVQRFGSYASIPSVYTQILYFLICAETIAIGVLKNRRIMRSMRMMDDRITFFRIIRESHAGNFAHVYIPMLFLMIFFALFMFHTGATPYIVPGVTVLLGLEYNVFSLVTHIVVYRVAGYWMMATGLLCLLIPGLHPTVELAITVGGGLLLFGLISPKYEDAPERNR